MTFPTCAFGGREVDAERRFCRLNGAGDLVVLDQCLGCRYSGDVELELFPRVTPPYRDQSQTRKCRHFGDYLRTVDCELCGTIGKTAAVHSCTKFGECTWGRWTDKYNAPQICLTCPEFDEAPDYALPPLDEPTNIVVRRDLDDERWYANRDYIVSTLRKCENKLGRLVLVDPTGGDHDDRALFDVISTIDDIFPKIFTFSTNGITIYIQPPSNDDNIYVKRWQQLGYEKMLNLDNVRLSLQNNIVTGVFRRNLTSADGRSLWYYAGGMFAFRNAEILKSGSSNIPIDPIESWPARLVPYTMAGCVDYDGVGDLLDQSDWVELVSKTL